MMSDVSYSVLEEEDGVTFKLVRHTTLRVGTGRKEYHYDESPVAAFVSEAEAAAFKAYLEELQSFGEP